MKGSFISNIHNLSSFSSSKETFIQQPKKISILLHQPEYKTRTVSLNPTCPISILNKFYQDGSTYISNGKVLDIQKSFCDYHIIDKTIIVIISSRMAKTSNNLIERIIQMTNDEQFQKKLLIESNKNNKKEIARIRDIRILKNEIKRVVFKQPNFVENYYDYVFNMVIMPKNTNDEIHFKTEYDVKEPSTEALPVLW